MKAIRVQAWDDTTELVPLIFEALSDDVIDQVEIRREMLPAPGMASEPLLVAGLVLFSDSFPPHVVTAAIAVGLSTLVARKGRPANVKLGDYDLTIPAGATAPAITAMISALPGDPVTPDIIV